MKKQSLLFLIMIISLVCALVSCGDKGDNSTPSGHVHELQHVEAEAPTCRYTGVVEHWMCRSCRKLYSDSKATTEITREDVTIEKTAHDPEYFPEDPGTCQTMGKHEYWQCNNCERYFSDENCQNEISKVSLYKEGSHLLKHTPRVDPTATAEGREEYWQCEECTKYFSDENAQKEITLDQTVLQIPTEIPDFIVNIPANKTPVVLQLTDPQLIDSTQVRQGRDPIGSVLENYWSPTSVEDRCYKFIRETVNAVNPDLIIITGDIVYGEFDDNGTMFASFVNFMETLQTPWAPIFGNHDNESKMGADWQCDLLEKANYCLFEQKTLSGNGNYSVGIVQNEKLLRVFYMLDSNGVGHASEESLANGHTINNKVGFVNDQIEWYTNQIQQLRRSCPDVKISFAFHIQQYVFKKAFEKYGFDNENTADNHINIATHSANPGTDFGYLASDLKGAWDTNYAVWNGMLNLGVDSVFVGHEHNNSASVMYEGVRIQFGQKSSEYERFLSISPTGITSDIVSHGTSIIGGSVIPLSSTDGSIVNPYIYHCGGVNLFL